MILPIIWGFNLSGFSLVSRFINRVPFDERPEGRSKHTPIARRLATSVAGLTSTMFAVLPLQACWIYIPTLVAASSACMYVWAVGVDI